MSLNTSIKSKPPRSQAQREAARSNGAKSKGPVTAEGKARSALNSSRHALSAEKTFVLSGENRDDFHAFCDAFVDRFQPSDLVERDLCLEMAHARWRLHRAWTMETALMDIQMDVQNPELERKWNVIDGGTRIAAAWKGLADESRALTLIHRYEARLRRTFERALANLVQLQRERRKNEAHSPQPPQPEAPPPASAPDKRSRQTGNAQKENVQNEPGRRASLLLIPREITPEFEPDPAGTPPSGIRTSDLKSESPEPDTEAEQNNE